jgi:hypothetical protein
MPFKALKTKPTVKKGKFPLKAIRDGQREIKIEGEPLYNPIIGFEVYDNGIGFIDKRYTAFGDAFTDFNVKKGCKGIGRYTVLACFGSMEVNSNFCENSEWYSRQFRFDNMKRT